MRGSDTGALKRTYLHSVISESLWYGVLESELMFHAKLEHAVMLASLYGNPAAGLDKGNEQVHGMYVRALETMPYIRAISRGAAKSSTDELVEEWRKENAELSDKEKGEEAEDD